MQSADSADFHTVTIPPYRSQFLLIAVPRHIRIYVQGLVDTGVIVLVLTFFYGINSKNPDLEKENAPIPKRSISEVDMQKTENVLSVRVSVLGRY